MELRPRYDGPAVVTLDGVVDDPAVPMLAQRARLAGTLALLDDEQWAAPSRCAGWSVQDVVAHLVVTNQFWAFSVASGRAGEPTRLLADFDPVATPAQLVDAVRDWPPSKALAKFVSTNDDLAVAVADMTEADWDRTGEAPPGHLGMRLVVMHALWDAWVHERDIAVPLGLPLADEPDEVATALAYAAALGPTVAAAAGSDRRGALEVRATNPVLRCVVEAGPSVHVHDGDAPAGAVVVTGEALDLIESFSVRRPFDPPLAAADAWLVSGLADLFAG